MMQMITVVPGFLLLFSAALLLQTVQTHTYITAHTHSHTQTDTHTKIHPPPLIPFV